MDLTLADRGLALTSFTLAELSLFSQRIVQRLTPPLAALESQLNNVSSRQHGWIGSLLAGSAMGLLRTPRAESVLRVILSLDLVHSG